MKCSQCGQAVPEGAIYCPFCTGGKQVGEKDIIRAGIRAGLIGLLVGLVPAVVLLTIFGAERGIKAIAFITPAITGVTGLMWGMVKTKWN